MYLHFVSKSFRFVFMISIDYITTKRSESIKKMHELSLIASLHGQGVFIFCCKNFLLRSILRFDSSGFNRYGELYFTTALRCRQYFHIWAESYRTFQENRCTATTPSLDLYKRIILAVRYSLAVELYNNFPF